MTLLILLGCLPDPPSTTKPPGVDPLPVNRACVVRADDDPADAPAEVEVEVSGVVFQALDHASTGCRDREEWAGHAEVTWDEDVPSAWLVIVEEDGTAWTVSATNPWVPAPPESLVGQWVDVRYRSVFGEPFAGVDAETELVLETPGYDFWLGNAGSVEALTPSPAVALAVGDEEVQVETDCGVYARHALVGTWDGETAAVATDDTYGFGSLALWNGGVTTDVDLTCSETTYRGVSAFVWGME